jgi:hypothetical protein
MEASGTRAMEGSPAARLPEADSLPDGFVESLAADQVPPPSSGPVVDDPPRTDLDSDRTAASIPDVGETLGAPSLSTSAVAAGEVLDASSAADALGASFWTPLWSRSGLRSGKDPPTTQQVIPPYFSLDYFSVSVELPDLCLVLSAFVRVKIQGKCRNF